MHRLFFALSPAPAQRRLLHQAVQDGLVPGQGRAVRCDNLHLTLTFIGSVPSAQLAPLQEVARAVASAWRGGTIELYFPALQYWVRPRILCALAAVVPPLADTLAPLARALQAAAGAAGFAPDLKPFHPHVTVARKVGLPPGADALRPPGLSGVRWHCDRFALMESVSGAGGPLYSSVDSWLLVEAQKAHE